MGKIIDEVGGACVCVYWELGWELGEGIIINLKGDFCRWLDIFLFGLERESGKLVWK